MVEHEKMHCETPENCNQIGHQMFSGAVSCIRMHACTASQECSHFPSKQCDTFSLYGRRLAHTVSNVRMPYFAVTLTNYTEEC